MRYVRFWSCISSMQWRRRKRFLKSGGFTLIEVCVVVAIIGILAAIAIPSMFHYIHKARVTRTIAEMKSIEQSLINYSLFNGQFPESLDAVGCGDLTDCWGNPYQYTRVAGNPVGKL